MYKMCTIVPGTPICECVGLCSSLSFSFFSFLSFFVAEFRPENLYVDRKRVCKFLCIPFFFFFFFLNSTKKIVSLRETVFLVIFRHILLLFCSCFTSCFGHYFLLSLFSPFSLPFHLKSFTVTQSIED